MKILIIYLRTNFQRNPMCKRNFGIFESNKFTVIQERYLQETSRNHILERSLARSIQNCEENKSRRLNGIPLHTPNSTISKNFSKYRKEFRDRLTFTPLTEKPFVVLISFLLPM